MRQFTKEKAIELANSKFYEKMTDEQIFEFQGSQRLMCMPFDVFHKATESVLSRPVFTHEFVKWDNLKDEYYGKKPKPTLKQIIEMIPESKRIIAIVT